MLTIKADPTLVKRALTQLEREQLPFARALAATNTAMLVQVGVLDVMGQRLDRPTPATMKSLFLKSATKARPAARVYFKDAFTSGIAADKWMQNVILGGRRGHKGFELALIRRGIMRKGEYAIPVNDVLNDFGNVSRGLMTRILSGMGAAEVKAGYMMNATNSRRSLRKGNASKFFVHDEGGVRGIWMRHGRGGKQARPIFIFAPSAPGYRVIVPFFKIAENMVKANYQTEFELALRQAMATARP